MLCGFSSLWWPFGWNWSYLGFLGIIWRTCGSKCGGEGGGIFPTLCVECCLVLEMQWSHFQWSYEIIEAFYFHFISTYWTLFIPCDQDKTMGNTKAVDDLVTQGTRASAAMVSRLHEINLCVFHEKLCQPHAAFQSCWMILKTNAWFVLKISRCNSSILKCFFFNGSN